MTIAKETRWLDATAQAALVAQGEVSALELLDAAIERIEALDPLLCAVPLRWWDEARAAAAEVRPGPAFAGVPFLVKDLGVHVRGQVLTDGNAALAAARPISDHDATLVERQRAMGLVIAGRTTSSELGSLPVTESDAFGATRNPWAPDRTPGGSSGGAAAAVAAGLVPMAHGSDGGGSIRIPASCCGLFGLKPSQGRITMGPDRTETAVGVDHVLTRSVRDSAAMLDATAGPGVGDVVTAPAPGRPFLDEVGADPGRLRIGLLDAHPRGEALDPEVVVAVREAAALLQSLGHHVEHGHPAALGDPDTAARYGLLRSPAVAASLDRIAAVLGRPLGEGDVQGVNTIQADFGRTITGVQMVEAELAAARTRRAVHAWWTEGWDLLLTPTLAELPLPIGTIDPNAADPMASLYRAGAFVPFTPLFNSTGQPAVSLPLHWTDDGVPVGVQLVAAYGREDLLLRVSAQLEAARPWADRHPDL